MQSVSGVLICSVFFCNRVLSDFFTGFYIYIVFFFVSGGIAPNCVHILLWMCLFVGFGVRFGVCFHF